LVFPPQQELRLPTPFDIAQQFNFDSSVISAQPIGAGNVNDTFLITTDAPAQNQAILQRINRHVFTNPEQIVANMRATADHINKKTYDQFQNSHNRWEFPEIIPTKNGSDFYLDEYDDYWRVIQYIENTVTFETIENPAQSNEVGYALGKFHRLVFDLDVSKLHTTLPGFHTTPQHLQLLDQVFPASTIDTISADFEYCLNFVESRRGIVDCLEKAKNSGQLAQRPTHGDPKLNNFLFNKKSQKVVALVDLDTIQPGLLHYDIGDCLRSCCNQEGEESNNPEKVIFDLDICQSILSYYYSEMKGLLTAQDFALVFNSIQLISFELGLRFLIDYMQGNIYFKTDHLEHNLRRTLVQFKLTESIESQEAAIRRISNPE